MILRKKKKWRQCVSKAVMIDSTFLISLKNPFDLLIITKCLNRIIESCQISIHLFRSSSKQKKKTNIEQSLEKFICQFS